MITRGTHDFRRTLAALFAAGFATFALLYCVQPLLPAFSRAFGITPVHASLALSLTTTALAFAMLVSGGISERFGRKPVMVASLFASAALCLACAWPRAFPPLLVLRAATGLALSGVPAISMAYVSEEMAPDATGLAMGLFIGASAVGGMGGRLVAGITAEYVSISAALAAIGAFGLVCAAALWRFLPPSKHFTPRPLDLGATLRTYRQHLSEPVLLRLYAQGFLLMGGFVTLYNYVSYRLAAAPYHLDQAELGLLFTVYLAGVLTSTTAGHAALTLGRRRVFRAGLAAMIAGLLLTVPVPLAAVVPGIALFTAGFFASHSVVSAWVGYRARVARAQASSLYLFGYYAGSGVAGSLGGLAWARDGWPGVAGFIAVLLLGAALLSLGLPDRPRPAV